VGQNDSRTAFAMVNYLFITMVSLSVLVACGKSEQQQSAIGICGADNSRQSSEPKSPYFYGLIEEYRRTLAEDEHNLAAMIGLGNAYFDNRQWKQAIMMYDKALQLDPRNADIRTDLGTAYDNLGMKDKALAEYHRALKLEPAHLGARYRLGLIYSNDERKYATAIHVWEEVLKMSPNYPHADHIRSSIAYLKKKHPRADQ
jgi:cytochrome c-type biogenesis protein CcmH/NrfG